MSKISESNVAETEEELLNKAQNAVSQCNWVVGECAAKWTTKYARGRTDADFANLVGLSADQVYQRRRVWETFGDVYENYGALKWSHFYVALNWDDAPECLQWAEENQTTVSEMKAWRRAMRGDEAADETDGEEWSSDSMSFLPDAPQAVRDPDSFGAGAGRNGGEPRAAGGNEYAGVVSGFAREADLSDEGGASAVASDVPPPPREAPPGVPAEQLFARMAATLERMTKAMTPDLAADYGRLSPKLQDRFAKAVDEFRARVEEFV